MWYLGLMSGTSLDGVDLALCSFSKKEYGIDYQIHKAKTIPYPIFWEERLRDAMVCNGYELTLLDRDLGFYLGGLVKEFLDEVNLTEKLVIASHGHTVFHAPSKRMTLQIGHGPSLRESSGFPTIVDFRSADVAAGGEGAPLVPIADRDLFAEYPICLNLGGFANISIKEHSEIKAFDICACNTVLNDLANKIGMPYDDGGRMAKSGNPVPALMSDLETLPMYSQYPKLSLGREFVQETLNPLLSRYPNERIEDILASYTQHVANMIAQATSEIRNVRALVTGGGANNTFLIDLLRDKSPSITWALPEKELISFKEALAFAYLGYLHQNGLAGNMPNVTRAIGPRMLGTYCA